MDHKVSRFIYIKFGVLFFDQLLFSINDIRTIIISQSESIVRLI